MTTASKERAGQPRYPLRCGRCTKKFEDHYFGTTGVTYEQSTYRCTPDGEKNYWVELSSKLAELNGISTDRATGELLNPGLPSRGRWWRSMDALCGRCGCRFGSHLCAAGYPDGNQMICRQGDRPQPWMDLVSTEIPAGTVTVKPAPMVASPVVVLEFKGQKITGYADGSFIEVTKEPEVELTDFEVMVSMLEPYEDQV